MMMALTGGRLVSPKVSKSGSCKRQGRHRFFRRETYGFHCRGITASGVPLLEFSHPESAVRLHGYGIR